MTVQKIPMTQSALRVAFACAALALAAVPMSASADLVFQSVSDLTDASQISTYGWCSSCSGSYRIFDQFTLGSSESITGFSVSLYSGSPYWGNGMNFSVWSIGAGNTVGNELFSQNLADADFSATALAGAGVPSVIASTDKLSGLSLDAGSYYVSFYNPSGLAVNGYFGGGGNLYQQGVGNYQGTSAGFTLSNDGNAVPEPASLALVGLAGLAAFAARRRRS